MPEIEITTEFIYYTNIHGWVSAEKIPKNEYIVVYLRNQDLKKYRSVKGIGFKRHSILTKLLGIDKRVNMCKQKMLKEYTKLKKMEEESDETKNTIT